MEVLLRRFTEHSYSSNKKRRMEQFCEPPEEVAANCGGEWQEHDSGWIGHPSMFRSLDVMNVVCKSHADVVQL